MGETIAEWPSRKPSSGRSSRSSSPTSSASRRSPSSSTPRTSRRFRTPTSTRCARRSAATAGSSRSSSATRRWPCSECRVTRDDDAERAVRAALALTAAIEQLGARVGSSRARSRVRVGVNSGEVVHTPEAGPEEATSPATRSTSRRGCRRRPPPATSRRRDDGARGRGCGRAGRRAPLELKGKAEPVLARGVRRPSAPSRRATRRWARCERRCSAARRSSPACSRRSQRRAARASPRCSSSRRRASARRGSSRSSPSARRGPAVARARLRPDVLVAVRARRAAAPAPRARPTRRR